MQIATSLIPFNWKVFLSNKHKLLERIKTELKLP